MRILLFLFFLPAAAVVCPAQYLGGFPKVLGNKKTSAHRHIHDTRFYLVIPPGFHVQPYESSIVSDDGSASIQIQDTQGPDAKSYLQYRKEVLEITKNGSVQLRDSLRVRIGPYDGLCLVIGSSYPSALISCDLFFGNTDFTAEIIASFPAEDTVRLKTFIKTLGNLCYDGSMQLDHVKEAYFIWDDAASPYRFYKKNGDVYVFAQQGGQEDGTGKSFINVFMSARDSLKSAKAYCYNEEVRLTYDGATVYRVDMMYSGAVNGCEVYEARMKYLEDGELRVLYVYVITDKDRVLVMRGYVNKEPDAVISEMQKFSHTLSFKPTNRF